MSEITIQLAAEHNLTAEEYERVLEILGRKPTIAELGIFSVMWSEHCSYKSSRLHLKRLPTKGPAVVQGPGENAGIVDIGNGWVCAFKIESHNHPSFVEPFQGAATGVGGILRDIFTMGARPIAVMDSLRFGPIQERNGENRKPASCNTARNRRIVRGVVSGIAFYGNCFGVPTVGGETVFDPCYESNPLVNVFALGIARKDEIFYARAAGPGNPVIYVGAKTGRDGIHGASLLASSEFSSADGQQKRPNVQVGDPFLEKLLLEACLEAMRTGAVRGIQDMGAAGLTCSTCEMGGRGGVGIEIELERVPQRETGMSPYEIMLSESQERMLLVAERGREHEVAAVFRKWGLDAAEIGTVIPEPVLRVKQHGEIVAEIPNHALTEEAPTYDRSQTLARSPAPREPSAPLAPRSGAKLGQDLLAILGTPSIASKRWVFEQYDSMVRTNTVIGPGGDAALLRLKETGQGLAMAVDGNGRYCFLNPQRGGQLAVAEAARNVSVTGALPLAATNCLNFGNPEKPAVMGQFREVIEGIAEACEALAVPITGGNVSFYNETEGSPIHPTPVIGVVGLLAEAERHVRPWFVSEGSSLLILGGVPSSVRESSVSFGSSQYAETVLGELWGLPPFIDLKHEQRVQACCRRLIAEQVVESAHDVSDGGLAVALAECCFGRSIGATVELPPDSDPRSWLFAEDPSRILVSVNEEHLADAKRIAEEYNVAAEVIGTTRGTRKGTTLRVIQEGHVVFEIPIATLRVPYETGVEREIESIDSSEFGGD